MYMSKHAREYPMRNIQCACIYMHVVYTWYMYMYMYIYIYNYYTVVYACHCILFHSINVNTHAL